jgi:hypothetical protein
MLVSPPPLWEQGKLENDALCREASCQISTVHCYSAMVSGDGDAKSRIWS